METGPNSFSKIENLLTSEFPSVENHLSPDFGGHMLSGSPSGHLKIEVTSGPISESAFFPVIPIGVLLGEPAISNIPSEEVTSRFTSGLITFPSNQPQRSFAIGPNFNLTRICMSSGN